MLSSLTLALHNVRDERSIEVIVQGDKTDRLRLADGITILAESEQDLKDVMDKMENIMDRKYSMKISKRKTKILICSGDENARIQVKINGQILKEV
jgi:hypothetical protein